MSLNDKKNALFSKTSTSSASATTSKPAPTLSNPINTSSNSSYNPGMGTGTTTSNFLSSAQKEKKLEEAKEHLAKANKYLETSMFQWTPDHLGAASCFEKAANCYKAVNENQNAMNFYVKSAESHQQVHISII